MGGLLASVMALSSLYGASFRSSEVQPPAPEQSWILPAFFFIALIGMTIFLLWLVKTGRMHILRGLILTSVAGCLMLVFAPLLLHLSTRMDVNVAWGIGLLLSLTLVYLLWRKPVWYVMNGVAVFLASAAAGLLGMVLGVIPVAFLLLALAAYDAYAVRKKYMQQLAHAAVDLRLPIVMEVPEKRQPGKPQTTLYLGLGDFVMPSMLVVAAGGVSAALQAAVATGVLAGMVYLMRNAHHEHPGLPALGGGAILGLLVGALLS